MSDSGLVVGSFNSEPTIKLFTTALPNAEGLINRYKHTESKQVKVGERWVENEDKHWYNPFTWFDDDGWYESIYETRTEEYVDGTTLIREYFKPIYKQFSDNIDKAQREAIREGESFKSFFLREMDKLDNVLNKKIKEMKEISASNETLQQKIKDDQSKVAWLEDFNKKLYDVLSV